MITRGIWTGTPGEWNGLLDRCGGHLLQSWEWGDFKALHGWTPVRVAVSDGDVVAMASVLFRSRGPVSLGYIPRGPAVSGAHPEVLRTLFEEVDRVARARRALNVIVEPNAALPFTGNLKREGFVRGPDHFQPERTVRVPLIEDEPLLAQMHTKTRYSIRLADRRGVGFRVMKGDDADVDQFYQLLMETSSRNEFAVHDRAYYADFLRVFGQSAALIFAFHEEHVAAGLIVARQGTEAIYMYGASSTVHRVNGAAFGLQFRAMKWARDHGAVQYDLWGIPKDDPEPDPEATDHVAGTRGDDWRGLYKFKTGFGGEIVSFPPTMERRYHPLLAAIARRAYGRGGA